MRSNPCRKIPLLGVVHPVVGSPFLGMGQVQVDGALEAEIMGHIWDCRG